MIENKKQYQVTLRKLAEFKKALKRQEKEVMEPLLKELHTKASKSQIEVFEKEIAEYKQIRRIRLDLNDPAELAIHEAMKKIENMAADTRLTEAITHLSIAKNCVADFIDGIESTPVVRDNTNERERLEKIVFEAWKECTKRICVAASFDFDGLFFSVEPKHWLDEYLSENK